MKALMYTGQRQLEVQEVPAPEGAFSCAWRAAPSAGRTSRRICTATRTSSRRRSSGIVLRHGGAAPAQTGYQKGDPVVVAPYGDCGACDLCARGAGELCSHKRYVSSGAFCELVSVPLDFVADGVIRLDRPDEAFALVEPLACVLCGLDKVRLEHVRRMPDRRRRADGRAVCADADGPRPARGRGGAQRAPPRVPQRLGHPAFDSGAADYGAYDLIVVAVNNSPSSSPRRSPAWRTTGTVHMFAGMPSGSSVTLDARAIHYRAVTLTGSSGFALAHFHRAYEIIRNNPDHYRRLITHRLPLCPGARGVRRAGEGGRFKVLLRP